MTSHRASTARLLVLTLLDTSVVVACEQVVDPTHDSSAPTLAWHVANLTTQAGLDFAGSGKLSGTRTDQFWVTLTAADPQGLQSIYLGGESSCSCGSETIGQSSDALYAGQSRTLMLDAEGNVPSETSLELGIGVTPESTCEEGLTWQGTAILLFGKAANFDDGMFDGTLAIEVRP